MESQRNRVMSYVKEFNPWPRIRLMGTNIAQDTMAGITVAFLALPLISIMRMERATYEF